MGQNFSTKNRGGTEKIRFCVLVARFGKDGPVARIAQPANRLIGLVGNGGEKRTNVPVVPAALPPLLPKTGPGRPTFDRVLEQPPDREPPSFRVYLLVFSGLLSALIRSLLAGVAQQGSLFG